MPHYYRCTAKENQHYWVTDVPISRPGQKLCPGRNYFTPICGKPLEQRDAIGLVASESNKAKALDPATLQSTAPPVAVLARPMGSPVSSLSAVMSSAPAISAASMERHESAVVVAPGLMVPPRVEAASQRDLTWLFIRDRQIELLRRNGTYVGACNVPTRNFVADELVEEPGFSHGEPLCMVNPSSALVRIGRIEISQCWKSMER